MAMASGAALKSVCGAALNIICGVSSLVGATSSTTGSVELPPLIPSFENEPDTVAKVVARCSEVDVAVSYTHLTLPTIYSV